MDRRKTYILYRVLRIQMYTQAKIFFLAAWAQANRHAFNRKAEPLGGTRVHHAIVEQLDSPVHFTTQSKLKIVSLLVVDFRF